jgi:hypothetical protein
MLLIGLLPFWARNVIQIGAVGGHRPKYGMWTKRKGNMDSKGQLSS